MHSEGLGCSAVSTDQAPAEVDLAVMAEPSAAAGSHLPALSNEVAHDTESDEDESPGRPVEGEAGQEATLRRSPRKHGGTAATSATAVSGGEGAGVEVVQQSLSSDP